MIILRRSSQRNPCVTPSGALNARGVAKCHVRVSRRLMSFLLSARYQQLFDRSTVVSCNVCMTVVTTITRLDMGKKKRRYCTFPPFSFLSSHFLPFLLYPFSVPEGPLSKSSYRIWGVLLAQQLVQAELGPWAVYRAFWVENCAPRDSAIADVYR